MNDTKLSNSSSNASFYGDRDKSLETNVCLCEYFTSVEITVIKVCYSFLGSVGLIENTGVILVILFKRVILDIPSNWFVLSMAIADAITCIAGICLVFIIDAKIGNILMVVGLTFQFTMLSSTGNLLLLTFNRFLSVYNSLRHPAVMTISRAKCLVWLPWIAAGLILAIVGYSYQAGFNRNGAYIANAYYTALITMIIIANVYMFKQARDKRKIDIQNAVFSSKIKLVKREYRLLIRLLIVNLTFFGSCIPMLVMLYLYHTKESRQTFSFRHKIIWFYLFSVLNAAVDPLVYSTSHPIFKRYFNKFQNFKTYFTPNLNSQA
jgi:hypothetical protein